MSVLRYLPLIAIVAGLGAAVVFADGAAGAARDDWSPVMYPAQQLPLTFSHAKHLARGASCVGCHPAATTSRSAVDNLIPTEATCRACHPIDRAQPELVVPGAPPTRCAACHPGYAAGQPIARVVIATPPLKFDHVAHAKTPCAGCHGDLTRVDLATRQHLPTMASCLTCHRGGAMERQCADCHLTRLGGLVQTEFPHGSLVPRRSGLGDAHGPNFARDHRQEAMQVDATCGACHDRSECITCHQGVTKPLEFHPGNYVLTHTVDARRGTPDCSACHRAQSFCVSCHERTGVGTRAPTEFDEGSPLRAFHPPEWATSTGGRHAREARRNITSCASCHREDDCLQCHSAEPGGMRASPHPKGWRGSARCKALDSKNRRTCLRCHVTQNELGCDWGS